jgi:type VI secretion system protein ImpH
VAGDERATGTSVIETLLGRSRQFSFFQAIRLLQQAHPHGAPIGGAGPAKREVLRLRPHASLAFPTSDIETIDRIESEEGNLARFLVTVTFLGLYGVDSPLPSFYTEQVLAEEGEEGLKRPFLDLFHHRILSLFYRCWEKYRYDVQYQPGARDLFSQRMFALIGLGSPTIRASTALDWPRLLPYLGLLGMQTHSATVLAGLVSHYFGNIPVRIEEFVGRWVPFERDQRQVLGRANGVLGEDCTLGARFYDRGGKFRLHIGPVDFATYCDFLPSGKSHDTVRELIKLGLRDPLEFDVQVSVMASERPDFELSGMSPCRLGWSSWLGRRPAHDLSVVLPGEPVRR